MPQHEQIEDKGILRFLTCGSVDDGKSTLIGRLLYDSKSILADALHAIEHSSRKRGMDSVDLSLLTDGLEAEREQGITIDVAYRYFSTGTRKYILADAPGHEQYTRNMVTAASTADLAIILIDARKGILVQTRRHATLVHLLGIRHLVFAVNKMDLVDWSRSRFEEIREQVMAFARGMGIADLKIIPMSALVGDQVVEPGENLAWYEGPTLLQILESTPIGEEDVLRPFRMPVQLVSRPRTPQLADFRGYMGRVESGHVQVGDEIVVLPSGRRNRVKGIQLGQDRMDRAQEGQSVTILLEDEVDISRGDLLSDAASPARNVQEFEADLCWFNEAPARSGDAFILRCGARETKSRLQSILGRLDLQTLERAPAEAIAMNDIVDVRLKLFNPVPVDAYADHRCTGSFILIREQTNETVAAGMIRPLPPSAS